MFFYFSSTYVKHAMYSDSAFFDKMEHNKPDMAAK
jgi:hypothetical protein